MHWGHPLPLHNIEAVVVSTIKHMCCIGQILTPTQGLALVNSTIEVTDAQKYLVEFKIKIAIIPENRTMIRLALDIGTSS